MEETRRVRRMCRAFVAMVQDGQHDWPLASVVRFFWALQLLLFWV